MNESQSRYTTVFRWSFANLPLNLNHNHPPVFLRKPKNRLTFEMDGKWWLVIDRVYAFSMELDIIGRRVLCSYKIILFYHFCCCCCYEYFARSSCVWYATAVEEEKEKEYNSNDGINKKQHRNKSTNKSKSHLRRCLHTGEWNERVLTFILHERVGCETVGTILHRLPVKVMANNSVVTEI